ncbi:MAG: MarR family transcriptional regulator [Anaerolineae bacterium]
MSQNQQFDEIVHRWSEVFMLRSMSEFVAFVRNSGLSLPQITMLHRLYAQGHCGVSDVADHLEVSNAAASQMIERLVQQGLVTRAEDPHDRRAKQVMLTAAGRQLMDDSIKARVQWMTRLSATLTPQDQAAIVAALPALTSAVEQLNADTPLHFPSRVAGN